LLSSTGFANNEPKSIYFCNQIFALNLGETLESMEGWQRKIKGLMVMVVMSLQAEAHLKEW